MTALISNLSLAQQTTLPIPSPDSLCNSITGNNAALTTCKAFLANRDAAGPSPSFARVEVVRNAAELKSSITPETDPDTGFPVVSPASRLIILMPGRYQLEEQLVINHKVALIGVTSAENEAPLITAAENFQRSFNAFNDTLLYLSFSDHTHDPTASVGGFYSYNIHWDTSFQQPETTSSRDEFTAHENAIRIDHYPGEVRIHRCEFPHSEDSSILSDYLFITGARGDVHIGSNTFDSANIGFSPVRVECADCNDVPYSLDIGRNNFKDSATFTKRKRSAKEINRARAEYNDFREFDRERRDVSTGWAIDIQGYQHFSIHDNHQLNESASARIRVTFLNQPINADGSVTNNIALPGAPEGERVIIFILLGDQATPPPTIMEPINVSGNNCYSDSEMSDSRLRNAYNFIDAGCVQPTTQPVTTSTTETIMITAGAMVDMFSDLSTGAKVGIGLGVVGGLILTGTGGYGLLVGLAAAIDHCGVECGQRMFRTLTCHGMRKASDTLMTEFTTDNAAFCDGTHIQ